MNPLSPSLQATFPLHGESSALLQASVEQAFAYLDDFKALSAHMEKRSPMMLGSRMTMTTDPLGGRAVGSRVRLEGRVLGVPLSLEEVVVERQSPVRKAWRTTAANLLVIGDYQLGFEIAPQGTQSAVRVFIDYEQPSSWPGRWLCRLFGASYARWCTEKMARDAERHFKQRSRHDH